MRLQNNLFSHRVHPDIPRDRFRLIAAAQNVVVETALPKSFRKIVAKQVSGLLFPLRDEFYEIRSGSYALHQKMDVIWHEAKCMNAKVRLLRGPLQRLDCNLAAARVLKNNSSAFATNRDKGNRGTEVFVGRQADLLARGEEHILILPYRYNLGGMAQRRLRRAGMR